jgi:hypothetical protein
MVEKETLSSILKNKRRTQEAPGGVCSRCFYSCGITSGSPVNVSAPRVGTRAQKKVLSYWVLIRFERREVQCMVDSGQGLMRVETGCIDEVGHPLPYVMFKNKSAGANWSELKSLVTCWDQVIENGPHLIHL